MATLDGHDVALSRSDGTPIASRPHARERFPYGRRLLRWDELDFAYFIGYAMWNYLTFPALLLREDIEWRAIRAQRPRVALPGVPADARARSSSSTSTSTTGRLAEYDYVAAVFGRWAQAAHRVTAHAEADGLTYPSKRRVTPQTPKAGPTALRGPLMMWADVRDYTVS